MAAQRPPANKTIRKVVEYLASLNLSIYGQCMNTETGQLFESFMDYDADDIIKLRALIRSDGLWTEGDQS